ncbi:hypothetical protein XENTR_v10000529 [Xenopus tropicalis]|nr:hypothetical protein XENTR_v10000529 [Xenopus tropicalis]
MVDQGKRCKRTIFTDIYIYCSFARFFNLHLYPRPTTDGYIEEHDILYKIIIRVFVGFGGVIILAFLVILIKLCDKDDNNLQTSVNQLQSVQVIKENQVEEEECEQKKKSSGKKKYRKKREINSKESENEDKLKKVKKKSMKAKGKNKKKTAAKIKHDLREQAEI